MFYIKYILLWFSLLVSAIGFAQSAFDDYRNLFTTPQHYVIPYTDVPPVIDGNINDMTWEKAAWTSYFQDIEDNAKSKPYYDTRVKMLWDDSCLYIAAELKDAHVWATLTNRDDIVFYDNDFEIFINPLNTVHNYFEIEVNAFNTIFDLFMSKPYRNGGSALYSWDSQGMRHAVQIRGTINNPDDTDEGWTVELAIPFRALTMGNRVNVPKEGNLWRINFSRVQWKTEVVDGKYVKCEDSERRVLPENNWVWSPQGIIDMHRPERWGFLLFAKSYGDKRPKYELPYIEKQKQYLWFVYYKQQDYRSKQNRFAASLTELGLDGLINIDGRENKLDLSTTPHRFEIMIKDDSGKVIYVNEEGRVGDYEL
jgi:hypothetical protein